MQRSGNDAFSPGAVTDYRDVDVINKAKSGATESVATASRAAQDFTAKADEKLKALPARSAKTVRGFADPADAIIAKAKQRGLKPKSDFPDDPFLKDYEKIIAATDQHVDSMTAAARSRLPAVEKAARAAANSAATRQVQHSEQRGLASRRPAKSVQPSLHERAEPLLSAGSRSTGSRAGNSYASAERVRRSEEIRRADPRARHDDSYSADRRDYERYEMGHRTTSRYDDRYGRARNDDRDRGASGSRYDDRYSRGNRFADDDRQRDSYRNAFDRSRSESADPRDHRSSMRYRTAAADRRTPDDFDDPLRPSRVSYPDAEPRTDRRQSARSLPRRDDRGEGSRYAAEQDRDSRYYNNRREEDERFADREKQHLRAPTPRDGRITEFDQLFEDLERKRSRRRQSYRSPRRGFEDDFRADSGDESAAYEPAGNTSFDDRTDDVRDDQNNRRSDYRDELSRADEADTLQSFADVVDDSEFTDAEFAEKPAEPSQDEIAQKMAAELVEEYKHQAAAESDSPAEGQETRSAEDLTEAEVRTDNASELTDDAFPEFALEVEPEPVSAQTTPVVTNASVAELLETEPAFSDDTLVASAAPVLTPTASANVHSGGMEVPENPFEANPIEIGTDQTTAATSPFETEMETPTETVAVHDVGPHQFPEFAVPETRPELPMVTPGPIQQTSLTDQKPAFASDPVFPGHTPQSTLENVAMEVRPDFDAIPEQEEEPFKQWFAWLVVGLCSIFLIYLLRPSAARV